MTLGAGNLGKGCHHQAVSVGRARVAKQGFNPKLPSWYVEQATWFLNLSLLINEMGPVKIPLL